MFLKWSWRKKIYAILYKNNEAIMKLDDLTNKVRANFEQHIDHAKESPFFKKFADKFFKDFNIDSPDFSAKSAISGLKDRVEDNLFKHLGKDDGMGIDPASLKELQKIIDNKDEPTGVQVRNTQKFKL